MYQSSTAGTGKTRANRYSVCCILNLMDSWGKRAERLFWLIVNFGPVAACAAAMVVWLFWYGER